jgi:hypothetical protein
LLYRGTVHGFRSSDFHQHCDGHANTITLILTTKGFIFGGFTPAEWDSTNGSWKADNSRNSFLFTVKNPRNSDGQKFAVSNPSHAIYCNSACGPRFGHGCDMCVANECNANTSSYTNLGSGYVNNTGIAGNQVFTGEQSFTVQEIEVFSITA